MPLLQCLVGRCRQIATNDAKVLLDLARISSLSPALRVLIGWGGTERSEYLAEPQE